jgi:hypothetical protein
MNLSFLKEPEATSSAEHTVFFRWQGLDRMTPETGARYHGYIAAQDIAPRRNIVFRYEDLIIHYEGTSHTIRMKPVVPGHLNRPLNNDEYSIINTNAAQIAEDFRRNPTLNNDFEITASNELIEFRARKMGAEYNLDSALNPKIKTMILGSLIHPKKRENFKFLFELFFRREGAYSNFINILRAELAEKRNWVGIAEIDVAETLLAELSKPSPTNTNKKIEQSQVVGEYYCKITQFYGNPPQAQETITSSIKKVTKQLQQTESLFLEQPDSLSFSGNPMIFKLRSWRYLETPGTQFVGSFRLPSGILLETINGKQIPYFSENSPKKNSHPYKKRLFEEGSKIKFHFSDTLIELHAVEKPNDSGEQFPNTVSSVEEILPYFTANYTLNSAQRGHCLQLAGSSFFGKPSPRCRS